jgi:hypothetical protein
LIKLLIAAFEKDSYDIVQGFGFLVWLLLVCGFGPIALCPVSAILNRTTRSGSGSHGHKMEELYAGGVVASG